MGGATITRIADTEEEVIDLVMAQVKIGIQRGLFPDSCLVTLKMGGKKARLYELIRGEKEITLKEVDQGPAFHVGVAAAYGPKPEEGQYVGTVHVHS